MTHSERRFVFLAGLHRSGTSLLHQIIRDHPLVSGFRNTGVPQDEGQHLQSVYPPAKVFGGPGIFAFDKAAWMTETHPLAIAKAGENLFDQWSRHYDLSKPILVEKSPPNIIRTRFLQQLFPDSKFITILRHPLAVSYATMKWSNTSLASLLDHSLLAYEIFKQDMAHLKSVHVLRYEDFVLQPKAEMAKIFRFMGIPAFDFTQEVLTDVNGKYFSTWLEGPDRKEPALQSMLPQLERRANAFGYSFENLDVLTPAAILGIHG